MKVLRGLRVAKFFFELHAFPGYIFIYKSLYKVLRLNLPRKHLVRIG